MERNENINYNFVELSSENIHWFLPLYENAFGHKIDLNQVKKKYFHDWLDKPYNGLFLLHELNVVGFIGLCFDIVIFEGREELTAKFCDNMIHTAYQRNGAYFLLMSEMQSYAKNHGVKFGLGFGNEKSTKAVLKYGLWTYYNRMKRFSIHISTIPVNKIFRKLGLFNLYLGLIRMYLHKHIIPYRKENFEEYNCVPTIKYNYDFFLKRSSSDYFLIKLMQTTLWLKVDNFLKVGFMKNTSEEDLPMIFSSLKSFCKLFGIGEIMMQFSEGSKEELSLKKHFPSHNSWPILVCNFDSHFPLDKLQLSLCDTESF